MMPRPDQTGSEHAVRSILSSAVALAARPTVALLGSIWQQPMFYFGFLVPLSITVFGRSEELVFGIPPIIPISVVFLLVALVQGGGKRIVSAWQASPAVFWLYLLVVAIEVFLMFYHDNLSNWEWVAGRAAFFLVFLAAVASCENVEAAG